MIVIGLTGSIGMGKTTVARQLALLGAKICHADDIVHLLLAKDGAAVDEVAKLFPDTLANGAINRKMLGGLVFHDRKKLAQLEAILHPKVVAAENEFIRKARAMGAALAVLDIPLLFETGAESRCNVTIVASAPAFLQRQRVLLRMHMTSEKFAAILATQLTDAQKRKRAHFVVQTGLGKAYSFRQVKQIVEWLDAA